MIDTTSYLSDSEKKLVNKLLNSESIAEQDELELKDIESSFTDLKLIRDNYEAIIKYNDQYLNTVLTLLPAYPEYLSKSAISAIANIIEIYPLDQTSSSFLADFLYNLEIFIGNWKLFANEKCFGTFGGLCHRISEALNSNVLPFLLETGLSQIDLRRSYLLQLIKFISALLKIELKMQNIRANWGDKPITGVQNIITGGLITYLLKVLTFFKTDHCIRCQLILLFEVMTKFPIFSNIDSESLVTQIISDLSTFEVTTSLFDIGLILNMLKIVKNIIKFVDVAELDKGSDVENIGLSATTQQMLSKHHSFGWLVRFIDHRDSRVFIIINLYISFLYIYIYYII